MNEPTPNEPTPNEPVQKSRVSEGPPIVAIAVVAGIVDAVVVRSGGGSLASALIAGGAMAGLVGFGVKRLRRIWHTRRDRNDAAVGARSAAGEPEPPRQGGWANATRAQKWQTRWQRLTTPPRERENPLGGANHRSRRRR